MLAVGHNHDPSKTSTKKKNLNPTWNETFLFYLPHTSDGNGTDGHSSNQKGESPSAKLRKARKLQGRSLERGQDAAAEATLFALMFDHNILTADDPLGSIEVNLNDIPLDVDIERMYRLEGARFSVWF